MSTFYQRIVLDPESDAAFIAYLTKLGYNSSFTVNNRRLTEAVIRFSSNASKLSSNTVALTNESFSGIALTLHANNQSGSNLAGGLAKDDATVTMSGTVTSFTANLDGNIVMGESTDASFITLNGSVVTVNPEAKAGATAVIGAVIGAANGDGTYRTMTFINGGDGTYTVTYNTANTLSVTTSTFMLKGTFNEWGTTDAFKKTANSDIISVKKVLDAGSYEFKLHNSGANKWYGKDSAAITDTAYRTVLTATGGNLTLNATGGEYEFKFELSTNKLSVYYAGNDASQQPTVPPVVTYRFGDVNLDGQITVTDVSEIQRHLAELTMLSGIGQTAADADGDNRVSIKDATCVQMYLAEYTTGSANCGQPISTDSQPVTETPTEAPTQAPTQAPANTVTLNASKTSTGEEVWYAWTWNNTSDGVWLKGNGYSASSVTFSGCKSNIIFVRMNPSGSNVPSWDAAWNQTNDLVTNVDKTFVTSGWSDKYMLGSWS